MNEVIFLKQVSTSFLKLVVMLLGVPAFVLGVFTLPKIALKAIEEVQNGGELGYIVLLTLLIMYISAVPFYLALFQTIKLLGYIDSNQAFSDLSVVALKKIKNSSKIISCLYLLALPFAYMIAEWDDAPGIIVIGLVIMGSSLVVAVFASVLQRLLEEAINIKSENDLTV